MSDHAAMDAFHVVLIRGIGGPSHALLAMKALERALGEHVVRLGDELAIDFAGRISESKLTLELFGRHVGATGTARNWNALPKILASARAMGWVERPGAGGGA